MIDNLLYEHCQKFLDDYDAEVSIAEAHGIMTGLLCIDESISFDQWQSEMQRTQMLNQCFEGEALECMVSLFDGIHATFTGGNYEFSPFLPDDEFQLFERAQALSEWCQGFLQGLGHADIKMSWPGNCREIIDDLIAISQLDPDSNEDDDEASFMELTEYVRVGVELIRVDLQAMYDQKKMH